MRITIRDANLLSSSGHSTQCDLSLDADKIQFDGDLSEYTLEEVSVVMCSHRREHMRKEETHAEWCKRVVDGWPEWKKNLLNGPAPKPTHYILRRLHLSTMVKEADYFISQGGLDPDQSWGRNWVPVRANSIEDARTK